MADDRFADGVAEADETDEATVDEALDRLEELEELVDTTEERERVRETMRVVRRVPTTRVFGRLHTRFDARDVGEALVGSFLFGIPMIVEDGTLAVGRTIVQHPAVYVGTVLLGVGLVVGILHAVGFERVDADLVLGVVPIRVVSILAVASTTSLALMTAWGRAEWSEPRVAVGQVTVTAVVMAVGASLGDVFPGT